ncbi:IGR protein motif-domain-containing protein [Xylariaceae sp. FL0804]|nr:IGR protein motif-domain-containing protein [Xylariaceae sp. FL0804]
MVRIKPSTFLQPQGLRSMFAAAATTTPATSAASVSSAPRPAAAAIGILHATRSISTTTTARKSQQQQQQPGTTEVVPAPTPFVPDVETFLTVIGRGMRAHASKFPTWDSLFSLTSAQLAELGVEPPRNRRYLLRWRRRFQQARYGPGGDLVHVDPETKAADLRVLELPHVQVPHHDQQSSSSSSSSQQLLHRPPRRLVVNVPPGRALRDCAVHELSRPTGFVVRGARRITGPYALPLGGEGAARVAVTEGMWEDHRGHKVDGGERRRAEIRSKKRAAERREARERGEI